jgi:hypothetical protein
MRCSRVLLIWLCTAGCTKGICSRNSECAIGFVCTAYGTCAIAPDANTGTTADASDGPGETPSIDAPTGDMQDAMDEPIFDGEL